MEKETALKILKKLHDKSLFAERTALETLIPELKESEDEKIRKGLLSHLRELREYKGTNPPIKMPEHYSAWIDWLERQGEQKPADKVEPKFYDGDWVVSPNGVYWHIDKISNNRYEVTSNTGESYNWPLDTNIYHRFTIQDAKDGDALYLQKDGKEHIIIYKGVIKERFRTFVSAYCAYNGIVDAFCFADVSRYIDIAYGGIMPATKEQRDLLFQKMKEAGYEWDAEKKELKKVQQEYPLTPDECIMPAVFSEHSPAWSEEDEKMIDHLIEALPQWANGQIAMLPSIAEEYVKRLKALKPHPHWKPSDEHLEALRIARDRNDRIGFYLSQLYDDLKKLM